MNFSHYNSVSSKKHFLLLLVFTYFSTISAFAQLPQYAWANSLRGLTSSFSLTNSSGVEDITYDAAGNVYTVGHFYGSIDANPGSGTLTLAAEESGIRAFVIKSSPTGSLIWAKSFQGDGTNEAFAVRVDANGNVYFTGRFSETVDFNPGSGTFNMTAAAYYDMYMEKLDSSGNFVWAKKISSSSFIQPSKMEIDTDGNPIYVGYFSGTADFNPNTGATSLTGSSNSFILKLDPSGNFVFVKQFVSTSSNFIQDIVLKANGDMVLGGYFTSATDFDPNAGTTQLTTISFSQDAFICELSSTGNFIWAKRIGGANSDELRALDLDNSENILVAGSFRNSVDFDPGAGSFVMQTSGSTLDDIFIAKYSPNCDFMWARQIGTTDGNYTDENVNDIAVDPSGNVCIVGFFYHTVDFNPGTGIFNIYTGLNRNTFVASYNAIGAFNYAFSFEMESLGSSESEVIEIDPSGNLFVGGYTEGPCDMDPGTGVQTIDSEFNQGLLLKLSVPTSEALFALPTYNGCVGVPITLVSTNSAIQSSWLWSANGGTIANPSSSYTTITFNQSGFYSINLTVTSDLGTTTNNLTVNISVGPTLTVNASPTMLCNSGSTTLWAVHSSGTLQWSSGQSSDFITVSPTVTTTYVATVTASNGCTATSSQTIEVVSQPNVTITASDNNICSGESVTLTASGALDYFWSNGSSSPSITVSPSSTTNYSVTGNVGTCEGTANQSIQVSTAPNIAVQSSNSTVCSGASVTLTATGGVSYLWSTGQTTSSITVSPTSTTTYTVTGTNSAGCQNIGSKTITVGTNPNINVSASNNTPCTGTTITLTATGGTSYLWGGGQTTNAITVSPTVNTTYTVVGTNAAGCQNTANKVINVDPLPIVDVQSASNSICTGSSILLTATGADSYSWNGGQTTAAITVAPNSNTTYTVTGTNSFNCTATASKTITVNPLPVVVIQSLSNAICQGGSITLFGSGASTYSWNTGESTANINVSPLTTTTYTIIGTSSFNCQNTASKTITVNALPIVSIQVDDDTICQGNTATLSGQGADSYSWSTGSTLANVSVSPNATSSYSVTGTSSAGCQNTASATIEVLPFPSVSFIDPNTSFCVNSTTYDFVGSPAGGIFSGLGISGSTFDPAMAGAGMHTISYTYSDATCSASSTVEVLVDECLSINSLNNSNLIQVYPNPAQDQLVISGLDGKCILELFNEQGQLIWSEQINTNQRILDLSVIASGMYVLSLQSERMKEIKKLIVQH